MFRRLSEPLPLSEASMLALRPSLNAPVLNVAFLPVGPARAAIVVFGEEWGGIGVAIGIRSNEGGQVAVFRNRESIEPDVAITSVLEPALAEAEQLGFLFDEDMMSEGCGSQARAQATALWGRLMGELEMPSPLRGSIADSAVVEKPHELPPRVGSGSAGTAALETDAVELDAVEVVEPFPELVLGDLAAGDEGDFDLDLDLEISAAELEQAIEDQTFELLLETERPEPVPERAIESAPRKRRGRAAAARSTGDMPLPETRPRPVEGVLSQPSLSKFRHLESPDAGGTVDAGEALASGDAGSALGRIPLVRVKRTRDGRRRVPFLARLLASF